MASLTNLSHKRKYLRACVTTEFNKLPNLPTSPLETKNVKSKVEQFEKDLIKLDAEIQNLKFSEESEYSLLEQEFALCQEYQDKCQCLINALDTPLNPNILPMREESRSLLRRATAPLPTFSSKEGEDLAAFFAQLENTLGKHPYSDYDKLLILRQQISGRALVLIESLEPDEESYERAKSLLMTALASPEIQKMKLIKKLAELRSTSDFDPYSFVGEMRTLIHKTKKLDLSVEDFLQYFLWNGLNHKFQNILISITNNSRPSLNEMSDVNMFTAADRYIMNEKRFSDNRKSEKKITSSYAVNFSGIKCILCSKNSMDASHPIYKCPKFSDPKSKLKEIKKFNICSKCANDHPISDCRFKFKSACKKCNQYHFSYLCTENHSRSNSDNGNYQANNNSNHSSDSNHDTRDYQNTSNPTQVSSHSGLVTIRESALQAGIPNQTILPTFTAYTHGKELRILKDGGCQSNFVSFETSKKFNFKILKDNINLSLNGINQRQNHSSQIVEIPLNIGKQEHLIEALCLPTISISLELLGLPRIVQDVLDKGYNLADKKLANFSNKISDIDLILGTKSSFCLPEADVLFGKQSLYAKTSIGIILKGDCDQILRDLPHLPYNPEIESSPKFTHPLNTHVFHMVTHTEEMNHAEVIDELEEERVECNPNYEVLDDKGEINELGKATRNMSNCCIGPDLLESEHSDINFNSLAVTNPTTTLNSNFATKKQIDGFFNICQDRKNQYLDDLKRCSQFSRLVKKYKYVFTFINKLKAKLKDKNPIPFDSGRVQIHSNDYEQAIKHLLRLDQSIEYPEVFEFFNSNGKKREMPNIVRQLNIYVDQEGLLRVHSKLERRKDNSFCKFPLLLSKKSKLTNLIIKHYHDKTSHAGIYTLLSKLRKKYWVTSHYSTVKKLIRKCITCRQFNELPKKQSSNSEFGQRPKQNSALKSRYNIKKFLGIK